MTDLMITAIFSFNDEIQSMEISIRVFPTDFPTKLRWSASPLVI